MILGIRFAILGLIGRDNDTTAFLGVRKAGWTGFCGEGTSDVEGEDPEPMVAMIPDAVIRKL